jgi:hypothetical protein
VAHSSKAARSTLYSVLKHAATSLPRGSGGCGPPPSAMPSASAGLGSAKERAWLLTTNECGMYSILSE